MSITRVALLEILGLTEDRYLEKVGGLRGKNFKGFASNARLMKICNVIQNDWEKFTGLKKSEVIFSRFDHDQVSLTFTIFFLFFKFFCNVFSIHVFFISDSG